MTGIAVALQFAFGHAARQVGAVGNAEIHAAATDRRVAVASIAGQKNPPGTVPGGLPDGYFERARASNVCDIQFQREYGECIPGIGNDPKPLGFKRGHNDHFAAAQTADGESVGVGPTLGVNVCDRPCFRQIISREFDA